MSNAIKLNEILCDEALIDAGSKVLDQIIRADNAAAAARTGARDLFVLFVQNDKDPSFIRQPASDAPNSAWREYEWFLAYGLRLIEKRHSVPAGALVSFVEENRANNRVTPKTKDTGKTMQVAKSGPFAGSLTAQDFLNHVSKTILARTRAYNDAFVAEQVKATRAKLSDAKAAANKAKTAKDRAIQNAERHFAEVKEQKATIANMTAALKKNPNNGKALQVKDAAVVALAKLQRGTATLEKKLRSATAEQAKAQSEVDSLQASIDSILPEGAKARATRGDTWNVRACKDLNKTLKSLRANEGNAAAHIEIVDAIDHVIKAIKALGGKPDDTQK